VLSGHVLDARVALFASPATRMLLASDGLTTPLLQAAARVTVRADVSDVARVPAEDVDVCVRERLDVRAGEPLLVRRTRLVAPGGDAVSDNVVVARADVDPRIDQAMRDRHTPFGFALADAGVHTVREMLYIGRAAWPRGGACACRVYLLWAVDGPMACIQELFNPELIPAGPCARDETGADHRCSET
jgi:chorismate-pyruvate lyase